MTTSVEPIRSQYVLDTNALIWYLIQDKKLGPHASAIFTAAERGETLLVIPAIVIAELYYANTKYGLFSDWLTAYYDIRKRPYFIFLPFNVDDVLDFELTKTVPEMHDRIITGVAQRISAPLLTSDPVISASKLVEIVW